MGQTWGRCLLMERSSSGPDALGRIRRLSSGRLVVDGEGPGQSGVVVQLVRRLLRSYIRQCQKQKHVNGKHWAGGQTSASIKCGTRALEACGEYMHRSLRIIPHGVRQ